MLSQEIFTGGARKIAARGGFLRGFQRGSSRGFQEGLLGLSRFSPGLPRGFRGLLGAPCWGAY